MASVPLSQIHDQGRLASAPVAAARDGLSVIDWRHCTGAQTIAQWDALALSASAPNPFFESWNLLPALANLPDSPTARIAIYRSQGELRGLMPMAHSNSYYGYPLPHLHNWLHHNSFCGTPLVARGHETAFWAALLGWADDRPGAALYLHLTNLPAECPVYSALHALAAAQRRPIAIVHREQRAMLQSGRSAEDYFTAAMSVKKRKELRRQHKRLSELGTLSLHRHSQDDGIDQWCDDFLALEQAGWKGRAGSALACKAANAALFRAALHGGSNRGRVELLSLALAGKPIAMLVNFLSAPGSFSFKTAFNEDYARFSPGVLLQWENLALLERDGIEWCDSCAAADHPMIERIWREKRTIVRTSIGIGGPLRQSICRQILRAESRRMEAEL